MFTWEVEGMGRDRESREVEGSCILTSLDENFNSELCYSMKLVSSELECRLELRSADGYRAKWLNRQPTGPG